MTIRVGINGFGRIGRLAVRALRHAPELELVHVNEVKGGIDCAAHLLEFDTVHGRWDGTVGVEGDRLRIDGGSVGYSEAPEPASVPWCDAGVDLVLECSGRFRTMAGLAPYLEAGVRKVVVSAPVRDPEVLNVVMGCNHRLYDPAVHHIVTAASCTTNCIAPVVRVLLEKVGILRGVITTIHDVTNTQVMVDAPHADLRRARSGLNSLIPTSTGSASAITMIYPELAGRIDGLAVRVPLLNASLTDCVFSLARDTTPEELNDHFLQAANGELAGILGCEPRPLVSSDYVNDTRSGIVDAPSTMVVDGDLAKILVWYDNEYGYAHRLVELAVRVARSLGVSGSVSG